MFKLFKELPEPSSLENTLTQEAENQVTQQDTSEPMEVDANIPKEPVQNIDLLETKMAEKCIDEVVDGDEPMQVSFLNLKYIYNKF